MRTIRLISWNNQDWKQNLERGRDIHAAIESNVIIWGRIWAKGMNAVIFRRQ